MRRRDPILMKITKFHQLHLLVWIHHSSFLSLMNLRIADVKPLPILKIEVKFNERKSTFF